ncbi:hypothetical protein CkaCkLH20_05903 [Colletotrichum karsti]|uniref:Uncharacterized protein n=1 Tax=Colletotrichum karsti TaxID=1095194 RepID=A0A9P6LKV4_9PEZI|nr:uncharacterized protein CkaCkLH20_05903 [Colletotrichum karsti]KAF9876495.1 hypothetical protein CkaCkLH20_05903 [Colletotrichum karsti]
MINTAGNQAVSKFDNSITRIDRDVKKLNGTMAELRRVMDAQKADLLSVKTSISDVKRNISEVRGLTHLENAMQTASAAVAEVTNRTQLIESENAELQEELQNTKKQLMTIFSELASAKKTAKDAVSAARKSANEVTNLRTEFEQLKQSLEQDRSRAYESKGHLFLPSELDILASNITKIGNRASLVEPLQMELDLFKSRVLRLEATMEPSTRERDRLSVMADGTRSQSAVPVERQIRSNNDGDGHGSSSQPRSRKRKAPSDRLPDCQGNVTAPKLTKSGAIDKRTIKRQEKNHPTSQDNPEEMPGIATPNSKRR